MSGFTNADLAVASGTLGALASNDGGVTWTATFTPASNTSDASNLITLANAGVQDGAGNSGAGSTVSNNYAIDNVRPTATIVIADSAISVGETSLVTITFSEAVSGFTNADLAVANGTLGALASNDGGVTWSAMFTPASNTTAAGNLITLANAGLQDAAGNTGAGSTVSNNFTIDTTRPTATIVVADSAMSAGETSLVTITFSEAVSGFTNTDLAVANGTLGAVASSNGGVTWTATFTPAANTTDTSNLITLTNSGVQDAAGNAGTGTTDSNNYVISTFGAPGAPILAAASDSGVSNADRITNDNTPTLTGSAADGTTITLFDTDGVTVLGSTVASGGVWSITSTQLADGNHSLTVVASTIGASQSERSGATVITVDTIAPGLLKRPSVEGGANALYVFKSTGADPLSLITLRSGNTVIATAQTDAAGNYTTLPVQLIGGHLVSATATDAAGNVGPASMDQPVSPPQTQAPNFTRPGVRGARVYTGRDGTPLDVTQPLPLMQPAASGGTTIIDQSLAAAVSNTQSFGSTNNSSSTDITLSSLPPGRPVVEVEEYPLVNGSLIFRLTPQVFAALGSTVISWNARAEGGGSLPEWLSFNPATRTLEGKVPAGTAEIRVVIFGVDSAGKEYSVLVILEVAKADLTTSKAPPASLQGIDLLRALGLKGGERGAIAPRLALARPVVDGGDAAATRSHGLSERVAQHAQRFAHNADATLRHLEQVERAQKAGPQA